MEYTHIKQPFQPIYNQNSEILILGSIPSVKSRENGFYYGHPKNRFWKILAAVFGVSEPVSIEEKKKMLMDLHIAVWDVIEECDIQGSSDSSIRNVIPADIPGLLKKTGIKQIFANGKTAAGLYNKLILPVTGKEIIVLPSTSPANAAFSREKLTKIWGALLSNDEKSKAASSDMTYEVLLSEKDFQQFMRQSHFQETDMETCLGVWTDLYGADVQNAKANIKVWYRHETGMNKITVVMTIGNTYDEMIDLYESKGELLKAYALECFAMGILRKAYGLFGERLYEREKKYPGEFRFFDEEQMKSVPKLLEQMGIQEICCNEALALTPQKTVVFMTELSKEKREDCGNICKNCTQYSCPNRQQILSYGYQRILGNKENDLWKKE